MIRDESAGGWGMLVGSGILVLELCVLVPGLLAGLLLTAAFALPLLLLGVPVLVLGGLFLGVRRLGRAALHRPR
jgi:hypothetical protein